MRGRVGLGEDGYGICRKTRTITIRRYTLMNRNRFMYPDLDIHPLFDKKFGKDGWSILHMWGDVDSLKRALMFIIEVKKTKDIQFLRVFSETMASGYNRIVVDGSYNQKEK